MRIRHLLVLAALTALMGVQACAKAQLLRYSQQEGGKLGKASADDPIEPRIVRLTSAQYKNTILRTLANADALTGAPSETFLANIQLPFASEGVVGRFSTEAPFLRVQDDEFENAWDLTAAASDQLAGFLIANVASCTSQKTISSACLSLTFSEQGKTLFRRPLTADELSSFIALAGKTISLSGTKAGLAAVFQAMMLSVNTLHRTELGGAMTPQPGAIKITDYEMADLLAYSLRGEPADSKLSDLAASGALSNAATIKSEVVRLLDKVSDRGPVQDFFREYLHYNLTDNTQDTTKYPFFNFDALVSDTDTLIGNLVDKNTSEFIATLWTTKRFFARKSSAQVYGLTAANVPDAGQFYEDSGEQRVGILTQPSWLSRFAKQDSTDPIRRGKFIRENLLCGKIPRVDISLLPDLSTDPTLTMRDKLALHRQVSCAACHMKMDPLGFPFESFDQLGQFRKTEIGNPVDTSGEISDSGDADGSVQDEPHLMERLAYSGTVKNCFLMNTAKYFLSDSVDADPDSKRSQALSADYDASGGDYISILSGLFASDVARVRQLGN